jgi:hypothetical protein
MNMSDATVVRLLQIGCMARESQACQAMSSRAYQIHVHSHT